MAKTRRDPKGRTHHKGESFNLGSEKDLIQIRFLKITFVN